MEQRATMVKPENLKQVQVLVDYDEITQLEDAKKLFSLSKANEKKCHMLPAKTVLYESSDVKCYNWESLAHEPQSRFEIVYYHIVNLKN
ncbi:hypothetical protein L1987_61061 [Smallanthus sonchifolius]|uniref:Uncharacterized protein n=1 Tax=Smallanthus sonchifolius TaxID=185202 RepID=A0ACB9D9S6_9ASTR|nr:hypothetical protein L1987_61061 [Smallanthus sonchifolius]